MIIRALELTHFGKFHHKTITFQEGLNILHGRNEAGKSTIHTFISCMFYGMDRKQYGDAPSETTTMSLYKMYEPWENQGGYGGTLTFSQWGKSYRIERSFLKSNIYVRLWNETDGIYMEPAQEQIDTLLGHMPETGYRNTVSIGQLRSTTDEGLTEELKRHCGNLGAAKNVEIDLARVQNRLLSKKKQLEGQVVSGAQEQCVNIEESVYASERRLKELRGQEQAVGKELVQARKKEYELFQEQKTQKQDSEKELEHNKEERNRLQHETKRWEQEAASWAAKTGLSRENLEAGQSPKQITGAMVFLYGMMAVLLGLGVFYGADVFNAYMLEKPYSYPYSNYLAPIFLALGIVMIVLLMIMWKRGKKREYAYRTYQSKTQALQEANQSLQSLEKRQTELTALLEKLEHSPYMELCQANAILEKEQMRLSWEQEQEQMRYDGYQQERAKMQEITARNREFQLEIASITLALDTMYRVATEIQASFGQQLNERASQYLATVTKGVYEEIVIDDEFQFFLRSRGQLVSLEQLSRGTMEQIYFCIRLAATDMMWPRVQMPLMLDDAFAYYDDGRTTETLMLLKRLSRQVIILTCHAREKDLLQTRRQAVEEC